MKIQDIISKGDLRFSLVLALFGTWFYALQQTTFTAYIFLRLLFQYACWALVLALLLIVLARMLKHPVFGRTRLWYFPWLQATAVSVILSAFIGGTYALMVDSWTVQRAVVLIMGFLVSTAAIMLYLYSLVDEGRKDE